MHVVSLNTTTDEGGTHMQFSHGHDMGHIDQSLRGGAGPAMSYYFSGITLITSF